MKNTELKAPFIWRWLTLASGELGTCSVSTDTQPGMLHIPDSPNFEWSRLSASPHPHQAQQQGAMGCRGRVSVGLFVGFFVWIFDFVFVFNW